MCAEETKSPLQAQKKKIFNRKNLQIDIINNPTNATLKLKFTILLNEYTLAGGKICMRTAFVFDEKLLDANGRVSQYQKRLTSLDCR